jgi:hypothetical protein
MAASYFTAKNVSVAIPEWGIRGRGLHSSTFRLNLSRFSHKIHSKYPVIPPTTPKTPPEHRLNAPPISQRALTLS